MFPRSAAFAFLGWLSAYRGITFGRNNRRFDFGIVFDEFHQATPQPNVSYPAAGFHLEANWIPDKRTDRLYHPDSHILHRAASTGMPLSM
jgi:hypothetical protein